jgi:hypothetical protein
MTPCWFYEDGLKFDQTPDSHMDDVNVFANIIYDIQSDYVTVPNLVGERENFYQDVITQFDYEFFF